MLLLLSPSKTLDFQSKISTQGVRFSHPLFRNEAFYLIKELKEYTEERLSSLMKISSKLSKLNLERYQAFEEKPSAKIARPALLVFKGDSYTGFDLESFTEEDFKFAQSRLRILSGLYGILRPLDIIQPYRLEMGTTLKNEKGANLYKFWNRLVTGVVNKELTHFKKPYVLNLASKEYSKVLDEKKLEGKVITPVFKDKVNGEYRVLGIFAKRARGQMANYVIRHHIENPEKIKYFTESNYEYNAEMSTDSQYVFLRELQENKK
jgi:uncharacterized protein